MKLKLVAIVVFLGIGTTIFSQSKRVADRFYKDFSYPKAAKMYESIYEKGDSTKYIVNRIADCYYNNSETKKAVFWYDKLVSQFKDSISQENLFKYAQSLRSNGNYEKSDSILATLDHQKVSKVNKETEYLLDHKSHKDNRISIRNLAINTAFSDFGGFLFHNEVYYASASPKSSKKQKLYRWNNQPFLNIYKSISTIEPLANYEESLSKERLKDSVLVVENKRILPSPINTKYHESNPVFTKDGKTMYFTRVNYVKKKLKEDKKKTVNLTLLRASLKNNKWTDIIELPFNSNEYSVGHPALSFNEQELYFISDMPGGYGKTDLYKVSITEDGYGSPKNLGATVNTSGKEMFPFVGKDSTLYFSSDGHIGLGLLDIFQSKIKNDSIFSKPKNLEYPFNGNRDDFSFFIDESGRKGFFSSNREGGKGDDDIYSFIIYKAPPKPKPVPCTQFITGFVRDTYEQKPIDQATVKLINSKGEVVKQVLSNKDGFYKFEGVDCESNFTITGNKLNYKPDKDIAQTTKVRGQEIKTNLRLKPMIVGNKIVINPIYFDFDKSNIREDAQYELEDVVTVMNNNPDMVIKIESHTDCRGRASYNRSLSDRRAKSTRNYIYSRGIAKNRIVSAIGYGEDKLLFNCNNKCSSCTEAQHQANRRSYFIIVKGGKNVDVENKMPTKIDPKPKNK